MYEQVLAEVHDKWYRSIPESAADHVLGSGDSLSPFRIVDLGCGSGVLLNRLADRSASIAGFDISSQMVDKCRALLPQGRFAVANILDLDVPPANVVTMVGEILSYACAAPHYEPEWLERLFARIYGALDPGGLFLFDALGNSQDFSGTFIQEQSEFTVFSSVQHEADIVTRDIRAFLAEGKLYRKSREIHRLRTFDKQELSRLLRSAGFEARNIEYYGQEPLLSGRIGFECWKIT